MYDFYAHQPETREEIREWLTSWLEAPLGECSPIDIQGERFVEEKRFRHAFHIHTILRSLTTNKYTWWVFEEPDFDTFPKERYDTIDSLLDSVIENYYKRLNTTK